ALPGLTRAIIDAAIPGLAAPRIEALLRSLPKEARRGLILIAATVAEFLAQAPVEEVDAEHLKAWLRERRAVPENLIRFEAAFIPAHLTAHLSVTQSGRPIARGTELAQLRRQCAAAAQTELDRHARAAYPLLRD